MESAITNTNSTLMQLKTPPHSIEAEQMLIACILLDESLFIDVSAIINEGNFYRKEHQIIFTHIIKLKAQKRNVDAVTLAVSLEQDGQLDYIGGHEYLNSLVDATNSVANIRSYAEIVRECFILRELIRTGGDIAELGYFSGDKDVNILLDEAEQKIFKIKDLNTATSYFADLKELMSKVIERVILMSQREDKNAVTGIATHYYELDEYTSGLQRGELVIIAGRPGMGKTAFALNIAENVALKNKLPVAVFSLEMTGEQLAQRLLSSAAKVDQGKIKRGDLNHAEMDELYLTVNELRNAPIKIAEAPGINVIDLRAKVRRLKEQLGDLGLVVIDYVQIMSSLREGSRNTNRAQELADISRSLKALALEVGVPIILLSQLNREVEARQDKRPNIADLRESGALEQDADIIMLLYRDDYYNQDSKDKGLAEVNIAKNRSGSTGTIKLTFVGKYTRFENPYMNFDDA